MTFLGRKIKDKALLKLILKYAKAGIVEDGVLLSVEKVCRKAAHFLRFYPTSCLAQWIRGSSNSATSFHVGLMTLLYWSIAGVQVRGHSKVSRERKLKLKDPKSRVVLTIQSKFLGFTFRRKSLVLWYSTTLIKFKCEIKRLSGRSRGILITKLFDELRSICELG